MENWRESYVFDQKSLQIYQISASDNPYGVDIPLNKTTKPGFSFFLSSSVSLLLSLFLSLVFSLSPQVFCNFFTNE